MDFLNNADWLILVAGYVLARWDKRGEQQQSQSVVAAAIETRLKNAEDWIARHSEIKADFSGFSAGLETVTKAIEKLTERFDEFLQAGTKRARA